MDYEFWLTLAILDMGLLFVIMGVFYHVEYVQIAYQLMFQGKQQSHEQRVHYGYLLIILNHLLLRELTLEIALIH